MKKTPKILPTYYKSKGTPIFRDTTALLFAKGGPIEDEPGTPPTWNRPQLSAERIAALKALHGDSIFASANPNDLLFYDLNKEAIDNATDFSAFLDPSASVSKSFKEAPTTKDIKTRLGKGWALDTKTGAYFKVPEELYKEIVTPKEEPMETIKTLDPALIDRKPLGSLVVPEFPAFPTYQMPGYMKSYNFPTVGRYTPLAAKAVQQATGYDRNLMEGYYDEEGNYVPGELQNAQEQNRAPQFVGASSIKDMLAQREYLKTLQQTKGYAQGGTLDSTISEYNRDRDKNKKNKKPQRVEPFVTSDPKEYAYRKAAYDDSLRTYQMAPELHKKANYIDQHSKSKKDNTLQLLKLYEDYGKKGFNFELGMDRKISKKQKVSDGYVAHAAYDYKKPIQPVQFKKEVKENPIVKPIIPIEQPQPTPVTEQVIPIPTPTPPGPPPGPGTDVMPQYNIDETPMYATPDPGAEWVNQTERYIDWDANRIPYRLPRFRQPGHGGDLIKPGKRRYIPIPGIETRNTAYIQREGETTEEYAQGGRLAFESSEYGSDAREQYDDGGPIYTYSKRPGSYYQRTPEGWSIKNSSTGGNYVPIDDPTGERAALLNKYATVYNAPVQGAPKPVMNQAVWNKAQQQGEQDLAAKQFVANVHKQSGTSGLYMPDGSLKPQAAQAADWVPQAMMGAPIAAEALGALGNSALGQAANIGFGLHGASQVPARIGDWQDVAAGNKDWKEATAESLMTGLELVGGYGAAKNLLPQTYKINPLANKLSEYNRVVGEDAIADLQNSGLVRAGDRGGVKNNFGSFDGVRTTPYPSFGKGAPRQAYIDQTIRQGKTPFIISTDRSMKASNLGRHGKGSTMFPVDETGNYMSAFSADDVKVFDVKPHWLKGYKEVSKQPITQRHDLSYLGISPEQQELLNLQQVNNTTMLSSVAPAKKLKLYGEDYKSPAGLPSYMEPSLYSQEEMARRMTPYQQALMRINQTEKAADRVIKRTTDDKVYYDAEGNVLKTPEDNLARGGFLHKYLFGGDLAGEPVTPVQPTTPPDTNPANPTAVNAAGVQDFYTNWYSKRTLPFAEIGNKQYEKVMRSVLPAYNPQSPLINDITQKAVPYEVQPMIEGDPTATGALVYNKQGMPEKIQLKESILGNPKELDSTLVHEEHTRIMNPFADKVLPAEQMIINPSIKTFEEGWGNLKGEAADQAGEYYDYITDPQGGNIQSMLFEVRKSKNLQPNQVITDQDIESWKQEAEQSGALDPNNANYDNALYNLFKLGKDNASIKNLFNYIASNKTQQPNAMSGSMNNMG